jgi:hypothetical protein
MPLFRRGENHDVRVSGCERALSGRQLKGSRLLAGDPEPPLGSHLVTPRRGYLHHGIYVGARQVVHYAGFVYRLRRGPVEEVPFAHFACGQRVWVRSEAPSDFDVREVIRRARWVQVLLELQRDWTRRETYDGCRAIVESNGGGYGIGLAYSRDMLRS